MSEILQGGGGSPSEEERNKNAELFKSYATDSEGFKNAIESEGGGAGNASAPLANYLNKTGGGPTIDYEYKPYEMPPVTGNGEGGGSFDGVTGGEDYSDLLNPNGTPMPGHPDYEAWMSSNAGPDGNPDGMGGQVDGTAQGYTSWGDVWDGGGPGGSSEDPNPSGGAGDTSFGGGIGTGGFEGYSGGEGPAGGASNDGFSGTGGYGMFNQGGPVQYRPQGGSIWDTDRQLEIQMNQLPQKSNQAPAAGGGGGQGVLGKASGMAAGMIMKKVLGTMLGGPLGMLLSQGGPVQYKSHGGGMQAPLGSKKTANAMKVESHTKGEARKDMKFAVDEKRKQELHEKKLRVI